MIRRLHKNEQNLENRGCVENGCVTSDVRTVLGFVHVTLLNAQLSVRTNTGSGSITGSDRIGPYFDYYFDFFLFFFFFFFFFLVVIFNTVLVF